MPGLLHAGDFVLCGESEEDLKAIMGRFVELCKRRGLKINAGKSKKKLLEGEEGLLGDEAERSRKVASGRRVAGAFRCLVSFRSLTLECARVLHESLTVNVLTYGSETIIWREKKWSRIKAVHMDNLRGLLDIRRTDEVMNTRIRRSCVE